MEAVMKNHTIALSLLLGLGYVFAAGVSVSAPAISQTRYVTTSGSDVGNDCRVASAPCRTIQYAIDLANESDTVQIGSGTFDESLYKAFSTMPEPRQLPTAPSAEREPAFRNNSVRVAC
jgi:hypothetical protein